MNKEKCLSKYFLFLKKSTNYLLIVLINSTVILISIFCYIRKFTKIS